MLRSSAPSGRTAWAKTAEQWLQELRGQRLQDYTLERDANGSLRIQAEPGEDTEALTRAIESIGRVNPAFFGAAAAPVVPSKPQPSKVLSLMEARDLWLKAIAPDTIPKTYSIKKSAIDGVVRTTGPDYPLPSINRIDLSNFYGTGAYNSLERLFFFSFLRVEGIQTRPFYRELTLRMFWFPITRQYERLKQLLTRDEIDCPTSDYDNGYDSEVGDARTEPVLVMLSMKDRKVYVGWLEWVPPLRADTSPYIKIVPAWSGYRDAQTMRIVTTEEYEDALFDNPDAPRGKILAIGDISNASLYDKDVYASFLSNAPQSDQNVT